jgi:chemotaxis response regulator CheB
MALIENTDDLTQLSELDVVEQQDNNTNTTEVVNEQKPEIPDKYKGKSMEDIVKMHQEAEKLIGKQAQEVGEVRRLADELLKQQLSGNKQTNTPPKQETQEIDFFEDPKTAVQKAVAEHPDVIAARQATLQFKQMQTQQMLQKKHPDFAEVVQDGEFIEWVKASPIRLNMYAMADAQYDFNAADELLSTFKQIRTVKAKETAEVGQQVRKQNLKAAAVDVSGTGESSKKVYRRADLIRLRMTDPARYDALQDEIMAAYAEGRVK